MVWIKMTTLLRLEDFSCHGYHNNQSVKTREWSVIMVKRNTSSLWDLINLPITTLKYLIFCSQWSRVMIPTATRGFCHVKHMLFWGICGNNWCSHCFWRQHHPVYFYKCSEFFVNEPITRETVIHSKTELHLQNPKSSSIVSSCFHAYR